MPLSQELYEQPAYYCAECGDRFYEDELPPIELFFNSFQKSYFCSEKCLQEYLSEHADALHVEDGDHIFIWKNADARGRTIIKEIFAKELMEEVLGKELMEEVI